MRRVDEARRAWWVGSSSLHQPGDDARELGQWLWFVEEHVGAAAIRFFLDARGAVRGEDDDARVRTTAAHEAHDLQSLGAPAVGEREVGDDDAIARVRRERFRFFELARAVDFESRPREVTLHGEADGFFV